MKQSTVLNDSPTEQAANGGYPGPTRVHVTDQDRRFEPGRELPWRPQRGTSPGSIDLNPSSTFQEILGFGSALTDAALGVRWAVDLGADDYDLPGYVDSGAEGDRWKYYRLNNWSHNTLILNGHLQDATAVTMISRSDLSEPSPFGIVDLSRAYSCDAQSLRRGAALSTTLEF